MRTSHARGQAATGALEPVDLANPSPLELTPKRGVCITVVLALGPDAQLRWNRNQPVLSLFSKSKALTNNRTARAPPQFGSERVLALDVGCAQASDQWWSRFEAA